MKGQFCFVDVDYKAKSSERKRANIVLLSRWPRVYLWALCCVYSILLFQMIEMYSI